MKFKVGRDDFVAALSTVLGAASNKSTMPVLSYVLIQAKDDKLSLRMTDLDMSIQCEIPASVQVPGGTALAARKLHDMVSHCPTLVVEIEAAATNARIKSGPTAYTLLTLDQQEFPQDKPVNAELEYQMLQKDLREMLAHVAYAQSDDNMRCTLNCVHFNFTPKLCEVAATDGRRVAIQTGPQVVNSSGSRNLLHINGSFMLPKKAVTQLQRLLTEGTVTFRVRGYQCWIQLCTHVENTLVRVLFYTRLTEGTFPRAYRQQEPKTACVPVPKAACVPVKLDRLHLLYALERMQVATAERHSSVRLLLESNLLTLLSGTTGISACESLVCAYAGPEITIAFNVQYLMEPLQALTCLEVQLDLRDPHLAGVLKAQDLTYVLMPVRSV